MTAALAVVGSGPAGLYCAERLAREISGARVDVIERWPTPFGLVRGGVAPDHQVTKAITRVLDRPLGQARLGFFGNVAVGRDVSLGELGGLYDAVVLATGAAVDRRLGVAGEDLPGVVGSGDMVAWLNGRPGAPDLAPLVGRARSVVIVGNGNVALDMARLLAKAPAEFAGSDLDPGVAEVLARAPVRTITMLGRRSAAQTAFSPIELAELGQLAHAFPKVDPADLPLDGEDDDPVLRVLRDFAGASPGDVAVRIPFLFGRRVVAFRGMGRLEAVEVAGPEGTVESLAADLVVTCIGYQAELAGLAAVDGHLANSDGLIAPGLYVTGWARRGPSGTIATNRAEAHEVARRIAAELVPAGRAGGEGLAALLRDRGVDVVDWARWKAIDAAELAAATPGRVRTKFRSVAEMLAVPPPAP